MLQQSHWLHITPTWSQCPLHFLWRTFLTSSVSAFALPFSAPAAVCLQCVCVPRGCVGLAIWCRRAPIPRLPAGTCPAMTEPRCIPPSGITAVQHGVPAWGLPQCGYRWLTLSYVGHTCCPAAATCLLVQGDKPPAPEVRLQLEPAVASGVMELQQLGLVPLLMQQHGVSPTR